MLVVPAVDIKGGRCVRLAQGRRDREIVFASDPVEMAARWEREGAEWLHVVDLDGAFRGEPANLPLLARIVNSVGIPVQLGGGIRDIVSVERSLSIGVRRVVLGTAACRQVHFLREACKRFPGQVAVSLDVKQGAVAVSGWEEITDGRPIDRAREFAEAGVSMLIYTDVDRDGMMGGPNLVGLKELLAGVQVPVMVAGGIDSLAAVRQILALKNERIVGIIIGMALYVGSISLKEAIALAKGGAAC